MRGMNYNGLAKVTFTWSATDERPRGETTYGMGLVPSTGDEIELDGESFSVVGVTWVIEPDMYEDGASCRVYVSLR